MNILIAFHSLYGHTYKLAAHIKIGAERIKNSNVRLTRIKETLPNEITDQMGATERMKAFAHLPIATNEDLKWADCIIIGSPTYFGKPSAEVSTFLDYSSALFLNHELKNKIGGAFVSSGCQNGGADEAIKSIHNYFFHNSMIVVGIDCSDPNIDRIDKVFGTSPYGVSCVAGEKYNEKEVSEEEIKFAEDFGERLAFFTDKLRN